MRTAIGYFQAWPWDAIFYPIPWDSNKNINTKYIIWNARLMSSLYRSVAETPRNFPLGYPLKIGRPFFRFHLKKGQPSLFSRGRITLHWHWPLLVILTVLLLEHIQLQNIPTIWREITNDVTNFKSTAFPMGIPFPRTSLVIASVTHRKLSG